MKKLLMLTLALAAGHLPLSSARAQATTMVKPRVYTLLNNVNLTGHQTLSTNATGNGTNAVACWTNTLTPFGGSHAIGLSAKITNGSALFTNITINAYRVFDTGGGAGGIATAWGTNWESSPFFTWIITDTGMTSLNLTNLLPSQWEPATALGFTIVNASESNTSLTLTMSQAP